jgi:predicted  nucleic acid-binding Zn-ribbon protein
MAEEEYQENPYFTEINTKIRDLEEKQRILKDRTMLIGENLLELKESVNEDAIEIKKNLESLKQQVERLKSFLETASEEFSRFARKEDLEIIAKQVKMFKPFYSENNKNSEEN